MPGQGSTFNFYFDLPKNEIQSQGYMRSLNVISEEKHKRERTEKLTNISLDGFDILVVDDNPDNQNLHRLCTQRCRRNSKSLPKTAR